MPNLIDLWLYNGALGPTQDKLAKEFEKLTKTGKTNIGLLIDRNT
jgi:hypothetical protein